MRTLLMMFLVALVGCAPIDAAADHAAKRAGLAAADAVDPTLSADARIVAGDESEGWAAQYYTLKGEELPADVLNAARAGRDSSLEERRAKKEAARKALLEQAGVAPVETR